MRYVVIAGCVRRNYMGAFASRRWCVARLFAGKKATNCAASAVWTSGGGLYCNYLVYKLLDGRLLRNSR